MSDIYENGPKEPTAEEIAAAGDEDKGLLAELVGKPEPKAEQTQEATPKAAEPAKAEEKAEEAKPEKTLAETAESDPAFAGVLNDLKVERAKLQEVKRQNAELAERLERLEQARQPQSWDENDKPTTEEGIAAKHNLEDDDTLTVAQYKELRANQKAKAEFEAGRKQSVETVQARRSQAVEQAETEFVQSLNPKYKSAGLSPEEVVTQENVEVLSGKDWKQFYALPIGSVERAKFLYDTVIARTPELKAKRDAVDAAKPETKVNQPKPASIPKGGRSAIEIADDEAASESERFHVLAEMSEAELDAMLKAG